MSQCPPTIPTTGNSILACAYDCTATGIPAAQAGNAACCTQCEHRCPSRGLSRHASARVGRAQRRSSDHFILNLNSLRNIRSARSRLDWRCTPPQPSCTPTTATQKGNLRAGGWTLSLVGELPIGHSFALSARAGLTRSTIRISNNVSDWFFSAQPATATQTRPIVGIGARHALSSQNSARLNWERFTNLGDRSQAGHGNVDLVSLGLEYSF